MECLAWAACSVYGYQHFKQSWAKGALNEIIFFLAITYLELQKNNEELQKYTKLQDAFPISEYILGQIASGLYNSSEYDQVENLYSDMIC